MNWRRRLDRLHAWVLVSAGFPEFSDDERERRIWHLLEQADRPDADLALRERAARVRELLERAENRREQTERA
jgi:hypothetical protein